MSSYRGRAGGDGRRRFPAIVTRGPPHRERTAFLVALLAAAHARHHHSRTGEHRARRDRGQSSGIRRCSTSRSSAFPTRIGVSASKRPSSSVPAPTPTPTPTPTKCAHSTARPPLAARPPDLIVSGRIATQRDRLAPPSPHPRPDHHRHRQAAVTGIRPGLVQYPASIMCTAKHDKPSFVIGMVRSSLKVRGPVNPCSTCCFARFRPPSGQRWVRAPSVRTERPQRSEDERS